MVMVFREAGNLPSGQVLLQLLSEANGAPILLAQVSSTHYVSIFEFTDAELCLNLETDTPFSMGDNTATMQGVIDHAKSKRPVKKRKVPNASVGQSKCNDLRNVKSRETIITEPSIFRNAVVLNEITEVIENIICQIEGCI